MPYFGWMRSLHAVGHEYLFLREPLHRLMKVWELVVDSLTTEILSIVLYPHSLPLVIYLVVFTAIARSFLNIITGIGTHPQELREHYCIASIESHGLGAVAPATFGRLGYKSGPPERSAAGSSWYVPGYSGLHAQLGAPPSVIPVAHIGSGLPLYRPHP
jgi:hypothetical protein